MPRNNRNGSNGVGRLNKQPKTSLSGMFAVPSLPPPFDAQPWFPLCLRIVNPAQLTVNSIRTAIAQQLQLPEVIDIDIRMISLRVWGALAAAGQLAPVTVRVFDPLTLANLPALNQSGNTSTATVLQTFPDSVNRARLGYRYNPAQSQISVPCTSTRGSVPVATLTGMGANSVIYFNILWRPSNTQNPFLVSDLPPSYEEEPSAPSRKLFC